MILDKKVKIMYNCICKNAVLIYTLLRGSVFLMNYIKHGRIFLIISTLFSFLIMTSCGQTEETTVLPDGKLDKCTLRFSWWGGDDRHEATLKAIELWNKKYPDIKIEPEYGG